MLGVSVVALAEVFSRRFSPRFIDDGLWMPEHDAIMLELDIDDESLQASCQKLGGLKYDIKMFFGME